MKKIFLLFSLLMLFFLMSCNTVSKNKNIQENTTLETKQKAQGNDFGLIARAEGKKIYFQLFNNTEEIIPVSPRNFGLIIQNKLYKFDPKLDFAQFPYVKLQPQSETVGYITFYSVKEFDDFVGYKLVFNAPEHKPVYTFIQQGYNRSKAHIKITGKE